MFERFFVYYQWASGGGYWTQVLVGVHLTLSNPDPVYGKIPTPVMTLINDVFDKWKINRFVKFLISVRRVKVTRQPGLQNTGLEIVVPGSWTAPTYPICILLGDTSPHNSTPSPWGQTGWGVALFIAIKSWSVTITCRWKCNCNWFHCNSFGNVYVMFRVFTYTLFWLQIIRTQPGHLLTVYYQSITGEKFELEVHDGNTTNATKLTLVNQWTSANQAVTPSSSSGHEIYVRFRFHADSKDTSVKFLITDDQGRTKTIRGRVCSLMMVMGLSDK